MARVAARIIRRRLRFWHNGGNRNPVQWRWQTHREHEFRALVADAQAL